MGDDLLNVGYFSYGDDLTREGNTFQARVAAHEIETAEHAIYERHKGHALKLSDSKWPYQLIDGVLVHYEERDGKVGLVIAAERKYARNLHGFLQRELGTPFPKPDLEFYTNKEDD